MEKDPEKYTELLQVCTNLKWQTSHTKKLEYYETLKYVLEDLNLNCFFNISKILEVLFFTYADYVICKKHEIILNKKC